MGKNVQVFEFIKTVSLRNERTLYKECVHRQEIGIFEVSAWNIIPCVKGVKVSGLSKSALFTFGCCYFY